MTGSRCLHSFTRKEHQIACLIVRIGTTKHLTDELVRCCKIMHGGAMCSKLTSSRYAEKPRRYQQWLPAVAVNSHQQQLSAVVSSRQSQSVAVRRIWYKKSSAASVRGSQQESAGIRARTLLQQLPDLPSLPRQVRQRDKSSRVSASGRHAGIQNDSQLKSCPSSLSLRRRYRQPPERHQQQASAGITWITHRQGLRNKHPPACPEQRPISIICPDNPTASFPSRVRSHSPFRHLNIHNGQASAEPHPLAPSARLRQ